MDGDEKSSYCHVPNGGDESVSMSLVDKGRYEPGNILAVIIDHDEIDIYANAVKNWFL